MLDDRFDEILKEVSAGVNLHTATMMSGLSLASVYTVMERGKLESDRLQNNPKLKPKKTEEVHLDFWIKLNKANSIADAVIERSLHRAAVDGDVKAQQWYLQNRMPHLYGKSEAEKKPLNKHTALGVLND